MGANHVDVIRVIRHHACFWVILKPVTLYFVRNIPAKQPRRVHFFFFRAPFRIGTPAKASNWRFVVPADGGHRFSDVVFSGIFLPATLRYDRHCAPLRPTHVTPPWTLAAMRSYLDRHRRSPFIPVHERPPAFPSSSSDGHTRLLKVARASAMQA